MHKTKFHVNGQILKLGMVVYLACFHSFFFVSMIVINGNGAT